MVNLKKKKVRRRSFAPPLHPPSQPPLHLHHTTASKLLRNTLHPRRTLFVILDLLSNPHRTPLCIPICIPFASPFATPYASPSNTFAPFRNPLAPPSRSLRTIEPPSAPLRTFFATFSHLLRKLMGIHHPNQLLRSLPPSHFLGMRSKPTDQRPVTCV